MKTSLKKLTSIFLAVLLVLSVLSVAGVSAAETDKAVTGDTTIHVTDNLGWGTMYVHYWGSSESQWPGVPMNDDGDNGYGSHNFSASIPDGVTGLVFTKGIDGPQTVDCSDLGVEGYWLDGSQTDGKYNVRVWGDTGEGGGSGGGEGGGEGGYNPGPGQGPNTVVLDASAVDTGYVDWRAWTWTGDNEGYWVGATGTSAADITYVGLEENVVFAYFTPGSNNGWDGKIGQTTDLVVSGSTFTLSSAAPGDGGVVGDWSGESGGNGGEGGYDEGSYSATVVPGSFGDGTWGAWTWNDGGAAGHYVSGTPDGDKVTFSGLCDTVIFLTTSDGSAPDQTWSNVTAQSGNLSVSDGMTFTVTGTGQGEDRASYEGDITEGSGGNGGEEPTQGGSEESTDAPTEPQTDAPTEPQTDAPTQAPEIETIPDSKGVTVVTSLNGTVVGEKIASDSTVTVVYNLTSPMLIEDGQGTLTYDSSKLKLTEMKLPGITESLTLNKNLENMAKFNFTGVDSETNSGKFDFKNGGVFVTATFEVVAGATGGTQVNLAIEELDALEAGSEVAYFTNSVPSAQAAEVILPSLQKVTVAGGAAEETTVATDAPTEAPTGTPTNPNPTVAPTIAPTQPVTQPATTTPTPTTKVKKANTIKVKAKTYKIKAKKLSAKKYAKKITFKLSKLFKVTKAKGKVSYKLVKSGVTKKIRKYVSIKGKNITIKKPKKVLAKGKAYKIKVNVTAKGNADYKKKTVKKTAKIKIK